MKDFVVRVYWHDATGNPYGGSSRFSSFSRAWEALKRDLELGYGAGNNSIEIYQKPIRKLFVEMRSLCDS